MKFACTCAVYSTFITCASITLHITDAVSNTVRESDQNFLREMEGAKSGLENFVNIRYNL